MAIHNYEKRFELKPGKFVYIQRKDAAVRGRAAIKQIVKRYKPHRIFFHFKRHGGHIAALRMHQGSAFFSRFDITNFFGQVTRTKVYRALRRIGFPQPRAFNIAVDGVVVEGPKKVVPYGFCQSPILATLVLELSHLGSQLRQLSDAGFLVSVYMDDILISCDDQVVLTEASDAVISAADMAGFPLSNGKLAVAVAGVDSFNCHVAAKQITVLDDRMRQFVDDHVAASDAGKAAIEKYVEALSKGELARLRSLL